MGRAALRALLHADQLPLHRGRGRVHRRRLRRPGDHRLGSARADGHRAPRPAPGPRHDAPRDRPRRPGRLRGLRRGHGGLPVDAPRRGARGARDALLVGHDGAPEGDPVHAREGPGRQPRGDVRRVPHDLRPRRGQRVPVPGAALPLGAAAVLHRGDAHRRHRRRARALRRRGLPGGDRALPRDPRPVRADDVRPHAEAARGGAHAATTCRRCASRSTRPRRARSTSSAR